MKAVWNGQVVAESTDTIVVENNHYFPADSLNRALFTPSDYKTYCSWKGEAHYYSLLVDGQENRDAAWHYPEPKSAASELQGRVAFWRGVTIEP